MPASTTQPRQSAEAGGGVELVLRRRLVVAYALLIVSIVVIWLVSFYTGTAISASLTVVEIVVLAFTLLILVLLSVFTAGSFSRDAREITTAFERDSVALLERSQRHWEDQSQSLERATAALEAVVKLERDALQATQEGLRVSSTLLDLERQREAVRIEEARLRKQRIRPIPAFLPIILHTGTLAKHVGVRLFDQGEDGRRVAVSLHWGGQPGHSITRLMPALGAYSNQEFDFDDIDSYADNEEFAVTIEMADVDGTRYRSMGGFLYHRNRGLVLSDPYFEPSVWQYPLSQELA
jgi:hypothetical protein